AARGLRQRALRADALRAVAERAGAPPRRRGRRRARGGRPARARGRGSAGRRAGDRRGAGSGPAAVVQSPPLTEPLNVRDYEARAAAAVGTVMCLSSFATASPEEVAGIGVARWFQLYAFRDLGLRSALVERARAAGYSALVLTVDTPVLGRRERDLRTGFVVP